MSAPVVPAVIPKSLEYIKEMAEKLQFSKEVQLDLVDGRFDDDISWPYDPKGEPLDVKNIFEGQTLEVDLMVSDPISAAHEWVLAGADMLVFHMDSLSIEAFRDFVNSSYVTVGIAAHGEFNMERYVSYVEQADYIQLMGIEAIGAQGQPFYEPVLEKIEMLRQRFPDKVISVDGSVNQDTIKRLKAAGVTRFIVGSAIVKQPDPRQAHAELCALINEC